MQLRVSLTAPPPGQESTSRSSMTRRVQILLLGLCLRVLPADAGVLNVCNEGNVTINTVIVESMLLGWRVSGGIPCQPISARRCSTRLSPTCCSASLTGTPTRSCGLTRHCRANPTTTFTAFRDFLREGRPVRVRESRAPGDDLPRRIRAARGCGRSKELGAVPILLSHVATQPCGRASTSGPTPRPFIRSDLAPKLAHAVSSS